MQLTPVQSDFRHALPVATLFVLLLWLIEILDRSLELHLHHLGVYPRTSSGLWGILFAPLIHGSWNHLWSNSFALLVLGTVLLYGYPHSARSVFTSVYLASGIGVWLFARDSYHFGASGLTHGMMFFIFTSGILRRDPLSIALSMIVFFIYGGMIWSIFPQEPDISYETHFFGALTGLLAAFLFRGLEPAVPVKKYDWEDDDEGDENPDTSDSDRNHPGDSG